MDFKRASCDCLLVEVLLLFDHKHTALWSQVET